MNIETRMGQVHEFSDNASRSKFPDAPCGGQPAREGDKGAYFAFAFVHTHQRCGKEDGTTTIIEVERTRKDLT